MERLHRYQLLVQWTGNLGEGTNGYRSYDRNHTISIDGKPQLLGSSDASFRGDATRHTPEDMLVASLATCHMLWYLHVCSDAGVVVTEYTDNAIGIMREAGDGSGQFEEVHLYPSVVVASSDMIDKANELHTKANSFCFIARSVKFPVHHHPTCCVSSGNE